MLKRASARVLPIANSNGDASLFAKVVESMATRGPSILYEVRQETQKKTGIDPKPGHYIDALMNAAAVVEGATVSCDPALFFDAVVNVLFLARHLAVTQGKIVATTRADA
jgi:hypothetical protein